MFKLVNIVWLNQPQSHSESEVEEDGNHTTSGSLNTQETAVEAQEATHWKKVTEKPGKITKNA